MVMSQYQQFIHMSRYARWREDLGKREQWEQTVDRYVDFFRSRLNDDEKMKEIREAILNMEIMPSMRAFMTAGKALDRDNVAGYNCSFLAIDHPVAFDELMYILMCGTGVGFSVERQYVAMLPSIAAEFHETDTVIKVKDSKIGWASAFRELISLLYSGLIPKWDVSKVRVAGARLKTFGGRASGPEPLVDLFNFTVNVFTKAAGRKLNSVECHDLACKIADIVVVGGVRRSALISLSNLSDDRMRNAKNGQWWLDQPQRALANNSTAYTEKPEPEIFLKEFTSLIESKSGERAIFNRGAAARQAMLTGRRNYKDYEFGTNPCVTGDTVVMTSKGPRNVMQLLESPFKARISGVDFEATPFWSTGVKPVFNLKTSNGFEVKATDNHKFLVERDRKYSHRKKTFKLAQEWVELKDLQVGDKLVLPNHNGATWEGEGTFEEGWLVGEILGDGGFNPEKYPSYVRFWGEEANILAEYSRDLVGALKGNRLQDIAIPEAWKSLSVSSRALDTLCERVLEPETKNITEGIHNSSSDFIRGFLRGLFDADAIVMSSKGISVRLSQSNRENLVKVQRLLSHLGIISTIYKAREARVVEMPDGKGGKKDYSCKASFSLSISKTNLELYSNLIGFATPAKRQELDRVLSLNKKRGNYKETFTSEVISITPCGEEETFDCTVEEVHCFDANGLTAHNCGEIILRSKGFCNLTEVIIRAEDTEESLARKVELATILGTLQSTLTNFRYLRREWQRNAEEERLLGLSLTGIMDHKLTSGKEGHEKLAIALQNLKKKAIEVNALWATKLGINPAAAITCVKPSGTVSQLVDCASGIHPRYSNYYVRRVRADRKDPLAQMLIDQGIPWEPEASKPNSVAVFAFPVKAPEDAVFRNDRTAIEQLEFYLVYLKNWCEHNPSITVYVKDSEWIEVAAWVYRHFDDIGGVSFLPHTNHIYKQAPYTEISKEEYEKISNIPEIDWSQLAEFEKYDQTVGTHELACTGGACEIL